MATWKVPLNRTQPSNPCRFRKQSNMAVCDKNSKPNISRIKIQLKNTTVRCESLYPVMENTRLQTLELESNNEFLVCCKLSPFISLHLCTITELAIVVYLTTALRYSNFWVLLLRLIGGKGLHLCFHRYQKIFPANVIQPHLSSSSSSSSVEISKGWPLLNVSHLRPAPPPWQVWFKVWLRFLKVYN